MEDRYSFEYKSTNMGASDFRVRDRKTGESFYISYRFGTWSDHMKKLYHGTAEEYERVIVGALYYVMEHRPGTVTAELVEAFKAHLAKVHEDRIRFAAERIAGCPGDKEIERIYMVGPACPIVRGGAIWDNGWRRHC